MLYTTLNVYNLERAYSPSTLHLKSTPLIHSLGASHLPANSSLISSNHLPVRPRMLASRLANQSSPFLSMNNVFSRRWIDMQMFLAYIPISLSWRQGLARRWIWVIECPILTHEILSTSVAARIFIARRSGKYIFDVRCLYTYIFVAWLLVENGKLKTYTPRQF